MFNKTKTIEEQIKKAEAERKRAEKKHTWYKRRTYNHHPLLHDLDVLEVDGDNILPLAMGGYIASIITGVSSYLIRNGGKDDFDKVKDFLSNNPDVLQQAQEKIGTDDINYISGYLLGSDGVAKAISSSSGLSDYLVQDAAAALGDALTVGLVIIGIPVVYTISHFIVEKVTSNAGCVINHYHKTTEKNKTKAELYHKKVLQKDAEIKELKQQQSLLQKNEENVEGIELEKTL